MLGDREWSSQGWGEVASLVTTAAGREPDAPAAGPGSPRHQPPAVAGAAHGAGSGGSKAAVEAGVGRWEASACLGAGLAASIGVGVTSRSRHVRLLTPAGWAQVQPNMTTLIFRMDDYASVSCTEVERSVIEAFRQRGLRLTLAVIPFTGAGDIGNPFPNARLKLVSEKIGLLREGINSGIVSVALHGYCHQPVGGRSSEFKGLSLSLQRGKIERGRLALEELTEQAVTIFVPPWNSYDQTTLKALTDLGFCCISAGRGGPVHRDLPVRYLPMTCDLGSVKAAVRRAKSAAKNSIVVCGFHDFEFYEAEQRRGRYWLSELNELLDWVAQQDGVRVLSMTECCAVGAALPPESMVENLPPDLLPPWLETVGSRYFLVDREVASGWRRVRAFRALGFYSSLGIIGVAAGMVASAGAGFGVGQSARAALVLWTLAMMAGACGLRDGRLSYKAAALITALASLAAGLLMTQWLG